MSSSSSSVCTILDIPDEILIKIILHLNARERTALGNSCERLNSLVFGDKELLRDLDFSKDGWLTSVADILQYFSSENTHKYVRKINIRNVMCIETESMLNNLLSKATNLVDVNILGTQFGNIEHLGSFLKPLVNIKRLSMNWPYEREADFATSCNLFEKSFGRLTYLWLELTASVYDFLPTLSLCHKLEELLIDSYCDEMLMNSTLGLVDKKLRNLKILQIRGDEFLYTGDYCIISMIPVDQKWTEFLLVNKHRNNGFYYERDVEVCAELQNTEIMEYGSLPYSYVDSTGPITFYLTSNDLLREVMRITHEDVPETFCCFTLKPPIELENEDGQACLLKIDDAKQLLKDPRYQISFLQFKHSIESDCDVHLIASAFPNLTVLILADIIKRKDTVLTTSTKKHFQRRLRKRGNGAPEEHNDPINMDSSFKMLVENTPHLRDFTIFTDTYLDCPIQFERWDLDALDLISHWKNLVTLRLRQIPLINGNFLIDIGKECLQLETIELQNLGHRDPCRWTNGLSQMLRHCRNLKTFTIVQCYPSIANLPEVLTSLCNNSNLTTVRVAIVPKAYNSFKMISSVERLLRKSLALTTFKFTIQLLENDDLRELDSALHRIIDELNRPNFQFEGPIYHSYEPCYEDVSPSFFCYDSDDFYSPIYT